jgi:hypothetical protein
MQEYSWLEVMSAAPPLCPTCAVILEEERPVTRKFRLLREGVGYVLWACSLCGFRKEAEFRYNADEEARDLAVDHAILGKLAEAKRGPRHPDPPLDAPPREFKTDEEALAAVYPDAIPGVQLYKILDDFWPPSMGSKDLKVERALEKSSIEMGERGAIEEVTVSYSSAGVIVYSRSYQASDGFPSTLDEDLTAAAHALKSSASHPPDNGKRAPREFPGAGVHVNRYGRFDGIVVQEGLPSAGPGYQAPGK